MSLRKARKNIWRMTNFLIFQDLKKSYRMEELDTAYEKQNDKNKSEFPSIRFSLITITKQIFCELDQNSHHY